MLPGQALRGYQLEAAGPIVDSIRNGRGRQFAIVFSRQSGKDELIAQLVAYLLTLYQRAGGGIVLGSPTLRPQSEISRRRAMARLDNPLTAAGAFSRDGQVGGGGAGRGVLPERRADGERARGDGEFAAAGE